MLENQVSRKNESDYADNNCRVVVLFPLEYSIDWEQKLSVSF